MVAAKHPVTDAAGVPPARAVPSALRRPTRLAPPDGGGNRASELESLVDGQAHGAEPGLRLGDKGQTLEHGPCR